MNLSCFVSRLGAAPPPAVARPWRLHLAPLLVATACSVSPPPPLSFAGSAGAQPGFADTVVLFGNRAGVHGCGAVDLACDAQPDACGANELLGPDDGQTFALATDALAEVAFRCGYIVSHGVGADLKIVGSAPAQAEALVEVSADGSSWAALGTWSPAAPTFSLATVGLDAARFVRLTNVGAAAIAVDAVQAL